MKIKRHFIFVDVFILSVTCSFLNQMPLDNAPGIKDFKPVCKKNRSTLILKKTATRLRIALPMSLPLLGD